MKDISRRGFALGSLENAMPNYSGVVSDAQIQSLILYIKTLGWPRGRLALGRLRLQHWPKWV
jgi:hypothetical protein